MWHILHFILKYKINLLFNNNLTNILNDWQWGLKFEETESMIHDNYQLGKYCMFLDVKRLRHMISNLSFRRSKCFMMIRYCYKINTADSTNAQGIIKISFKAFISSNRFSSIISYQEFYTIVLDLFRMISWKLKKWNKSVITIFPVDILYIKCYDFWFSDIFNLKGFDESYLPLFTFSKISQSVN